MIKLGGKILKGIHIFVVLLYLLACLIPFLSPGTFWWIATLGLIFPFLFFALVFFLLAWLVARSKWYILSLVAMLLSWKQVAVFAGLNLKKEFTLSKTSQTLRVLTWNISSWGETNKNNKTRVAYRPEMVDLVKRQQADILCFQEFWDSKAVRLHDSIIPLFKESGYLYSYYVKTVIDNVNFRTGVVILSKYPIMDTAEFSYGEDDFAERLIYADIQFNQQMIRVFTTHLQSVRFNNREYSSLRKIKRTGESGLTDSKTIVQKLKNAYRFRGTQADLVQQKIRESPYPVIICGDFNDVPNSYTYFTIKGDLQDAFLKRGTGLGRTFQYLSPTLRIDYILADKNMDILQFNRIKTPYSDHYPIIADFNFLRLKD